MICVQPSDLTANPTGNGLAVLDPYVIDPVVVEELNGDYMLVFTYPLDAPHAELIQPGTLVSTPVAEATNRVPQLFRISHLEATEAGLVRVTAWHVFYDLAAVMVFDTNVVNKTPGQAITQLLGAAIQDHPFEGMGTYRPNGSARYVRCSVAEAIMDTGRENSLVRRWGVEVERENFRINLTPHRGKNRGVTVRAGKNLTAITSTIDTSNVLTRVIPVGFDGLTLPEKYVDHPGTAGRVRSGVVRFDHIKATKDGEEPAEGELALEDAYRALRQAARTFLEANRAPRASWEVSLAPLTATREYRALRELEEVRLGDTLTVIDEALGLEVSARVVATRFDPLLGELVGVTLGTFTPRFTDTTMGAISAALDDAAGARELASTASAAAGGALSAVQGAVLAADQAAQKAAEAMVSADGKNKITHSEAQPDRAQPGDVWFKPNGEALEIWIYQQSGNELAWVPLAADITFAQAQMQIAVAESEAKRAAQVAEQVRTDMVLADQHLMESVTQIATGLTEQVLATATTSELATKKADQAAADAGTAREGVQTLRAEVSGLTSEVRDAQAGVSSRFVQVENLINARVAKGDVINQINISTEGITIDGTRIHITGETLIDNAVIQTAHLKDASVTNAKIANLDAAKITTGYLAASRIAAGSIHSSKLSVADGFITNAMIRNATITSAKIAYLDAGRITTGTLSANRIAAGSITADKLAANAIQVGLSGWTSSIRISPTVIRWYNGSQLAGEVSSEGLKFYAGTKYIGTIGEAGFGGKPASVRGLNTMLSTEASYAAWTYGAGSSDHYVMLTMDPTGSVMSYKGLHLGLNLYMRGNNIMTAGARPISPRDVTVGSTTYPGMTSSNGKSGVVFTPSDMHLLAYGYVYSAKRITERITDLMTRVNLIIGYLNQGWIQRIEDRGGGSIQWYSHSGLGIGTMSTSLN